VCKLRTVTSSGPADEPCSVADTKTVRSLGSVRTKSGQFSYPLPSMANSSDDDISCDTYSNSTYSSGTWTCSIEACIESPYSPIWSVDTVCSDSSNTSISAFGVLILNLSTRLAAAPFGVLMQNVSHLTAQFGASPH
jgi:hypothetical protein